MALSRRSLPGPGLERQDADLDQGTDIGNKDKAVKPGGLRRWALQGGAGGGQRRGTDSGEHPVLSRELGGTPFPPQHLRVHTRSRISQELNSKLFFPNTPYECE